MIPLIIALFHVLGLLTSIRAILNVRTAQGAIAWAVSLNTFPYVAVPAYWVFGRSTFEGYVMLRREKRKALTARQQEIERRTRERTIAATARDAAGHARQPRGTAY